MRAKLATVVAGVLIGLTAFAPAAMASGGSTAGGTAAGGGGTAAGGGGGPGGGTTPKTTGGTKVDACVKVNSASASSSQSAVTANAFVGAVLSVSTCGGAAAKDGFAITMTAVDPSGLVAMSDTSTWIPRGSTPYIRSAQSDNAAFATAYRVSITVVNIATGVTDATDSATTLTPAVRTPGCATVASLSGREGLIGAENALWAFYTVASCGPADGMDVTVTGTGTAGTFVINTDTSMFGSGVTLNGAHDFDPAPVDTYTLNLTVVEHSTGQVLATATAAV